MRTRFQQTHAVGARRQACNEFAPQARLAYPGVGEHRHGTHAASAACLVERGEQALHLGIAPDHRRGQALDAALHGALGIGRGAEHEIGEQRFGVPLHPERRLRLHPKQSAHQAPGVVADAQAPDRRALLHARRQVHGVTEGATFGFGASTQQHRAGVDAHAHAEAGDLQLLQHPLRVLRRGLEDLQTGSHRVHGLVLARADRAEGGLQPVTGKAQYLAAAALHDGCEALQRLTEQFVGILRTDLRQKMRGIGHIDEQHAHLAQALARFHGGRRRQRMAAQGLDRGIDRAVAQRSALRVQRGKRGIQRGGIGHRVRMLERAGASEPARTSMRRATRSETRHRSRAKSATCPCASAPVRRSRPAIERRIASMLALRRRCASRRQEAFNPPEPTMVDATCTA